MKMLALLAGGVIGGRLFGWKGALLGAGVGWSVARLMTEPDETERRTIPVERYPEEEMVDALSAAGEDAAIVAAEFDSLYHEGESLPAAKPARRRGPRSSAGSAAER